MQERYYSTPKNQMMQHESVIAAKQFIALFYRIDSPSHDQFLTLATAHYTLSQQQNLSKKHCKMHLNASITLLQNLRAANRSGHWQSLIANSYAKRAELFEQEDGLPQALNDYIRVLELFEPFDPDATNRDIADVDKLLIAQTAISIADLILNQFVTVENCIHKNLKSPLFYIEQALLMLSKLPKGEDGVIITSAYAYQMTALATTALDFNRALNYYRLAISHAVSASPKAACQILGDIYNSLGLLYEHYTQDLQFEFEAEKGSDHAMIYFSIALFFCPTQNRIENTSLDDYTYPDYHEYPDGHALLNIIFESIRRALDPSPYPLTLPVLHDLIEALIFIYFCIIDRSLPNKELADQFTCAETLEYYAQHIYWLVSEYNKRLHPRTHLQSWIESSEKCFTEAISDSLEMYLNNPNKNNVVPFRGKKKEAI